MCGFSHLFGPLPVLRRSGRIETYGTADGPQDVQVQTHAHSQTGAGAWARVLGLCRWLYNTALGATHHRLAAARVSVSRFQQEAELKDIRAAFPEYAAIHSHVLQDVLARLDKTYQAFFRRVTGGREGGLPALSGARPLPLLHLQGVRQRGDAGQWLPGPVQDRAYRRPLVASAGGHAQDRHDQPRSGRVVCLLLLRGCARTALAPYWTGNRHRPGD